MKFPSHAVFLIAVAMLVLLVPGAAFADPVGSFSRTEGNVDLLRKGDTKAVSVQVGDAVSMGDAIRTKRDGKAEIRFNDDTVIQLAPETRITIDQYTYTSANTRERGFLSLFRGKIRAIVSKVKAAAVPVVGKTEANFNVKTPTAIAGVKGTDFFVYYERGITGVIYLDGFGFVYNPERPDKIVPIKAGQATFVMDGSEPPLDAHPVLDSFVAPHLKDVTIAESGAASGGGDRITNVSFSDLIGGWAAAQLHSPGMGTPMDILIPQANLPSDQPVVIPVTPNVSKTTPVTVNVKVP